MGNEQKLNVFKAGELREDMLVVPVHVLEAGEVVGLEELKRLRADSAELARLKDPVAWEYQKAALAEHSNWIRNRTTDQAVEYLWKKGWRIAPEPIPEGFALVPVEPTPEMLAAIVREADKQESYWAYKPEQFYSAMLAAAQKGDSHE